MLGLPKLSFDPVLFLAPFLGGFRDYSGGGHHATNDGGHWQASGGLDGFNPSSDPSALVVPYNVAIRPAQWTWFIWGDFANHLPERRLVSTRSAIATTWYQIYFSAAAAIIRTETSLRTRNVNIAGAKSLAVLLVSGEVGQLSIDGAPDGAFSGASTLVRYSSDTYVGGYYAANNTQWGQPISGAILCPGILPAPEILSLHNYSQSLITPRRQWPGSGLRYPGRETNLIPEAAAGWTPVNSAILTDLQDGELNVAYDGAPNPYARDTALTIGEQYRVQGEARGDGVGKPYVYAGASAFFTGTVSDLWQAFDELVIASADQFVRLQNVTSAPSSCQFRNVKVWTNPAGYTHATGDPTYLDNIQTARVSVANETSGKLSNTGMDIVTGTWRVSEDATGRYYNCVGNGQIKRRVLGADAMVTRLFTEEGSATLTKTATAIEIDALATDKIRAVQLEAA